MLGWDPAPAAAAIHNSDDDGGGSSEKMASVPTATTPNEGGVPVQAPLSSKSAGQTAPMGASSRLRFREIACPHRNDRRKHLKWLSIVLIVLIWLLLILQIVATQQTLDYAPYGPIGVVMIVSCVLLWFFAIVEIFVFAVLTKRTMQDHEMEELGYGNMRFWSRFVFGRWTCCLLLIALIGSFVMLMLMVSFFFPEDFHSTEHLSIYRIAHVNSTGATFFARDVGQSTDVFVEVRSAGDTGNFTRIQAPHRPRGDDYVAIWGIDGLQPDSVYEWRMNFDMDTIRHFKTSPVPDTPTRYSYVFGSCFLSNFPYQRRAPGFDYLPGLNADFMVFMGDFIYADVPIYRGSSVDDYYMLYRQNFLVAGLRNFLTNTPSYYMYDDHEVYNDWDRGDGKDEKAYLHAIPMAWNKYLGWTNPRMPYTGANIYYFSFDYGDSSFFVMDTRTFRSPNGYEDNDFKSMLGTEQKQRLKDWLLAKKSFTFKFLVSSIGWTTSLESASDAWGSYLTERNEILDFIKTNQIGGCIFLSGDYHIAYVAELVGPGSGLYEFSASPISAFDWDLGGYNIYSHRPVKEENEQIEPIVWYDTGGRGLVALVGKMEVNTLANPPYVTVSMYKFGEKIYNQTVTLPETTKSFSRR